MPMFDAFPHGVCKADLFDYSLLKHFKGIYADLDSQGLQSIETLLNGCNLVIVMELEENLQQKNIQLCELNQIVCASFIASESNQPVLLDVLSRLCHFHLTAVINTDDVLECTGPFFLNRVFSANPAYGIHLIPFEQIYPFRKADCW